MKTAHDQFIERQARLSRVGEQWQQKIAYGDPTLGWDGDRALVLYREVLTDEMVIQYELPDRKPVLVFKVPVEGFDINKVCTMLRDADNRRKSVDEKMAEVDAHNDAVNAEVKAIAVESQLSAQDKLQWAMRKDTGNHIAPMTVPSNVVGS